MPARTRLTGSQEATLLGLEKNIRATQYPDIKDQRAFLDRQAGIVVSPFK
jgi:hypothetical protein